MATTIALSHRVSALRAGWMRLLGAIERDPHVVRRTLIAGWMLTRGSAAV